jgi:hypothetical protein
VKIETPILKRLGPVPFWRGSVKCLDELERCYRKAMEAAAQAREKISAVSVSDGKRAADAGKNKSVSD